MGRGFGGVCRVWVMLALVDFFLAEAWHGRRDVGLRLLLYYSSAWRQGGTRSGIGYRTNHVYYLVNLYTFSLHVGMYICRADPGSYIVATYPNYHHPYFLCLGVSELYKIPVNPPFDMCKNQWSTTTSPSHSALGVVTSALDSIAPTCDLRTSDSTFVGRRAGIVCCCWSIWR